MWTNFSRVTMENTNFSGVTMDIRNEAHTCNRHHQYICILKTIAISFYINQKLKKIRDTYTNNQAATFQFAGYFGITQIGCPKQFRT